MSQRLLQNRSLVKEEVREDVWCVSIVNHFRASFGKSETKEHRDKKYERWCFWRKQGFSVVTEAILKNGKRVDLIIFDENDIWIEEIIKSETKESFEKKKSQYPFPIFPVFCDENKKF